jgi:hypothetical protein
MSDTTGYIGIALVGGVMAALIAGGMYYASGDNKLTPTGMASYGQVSQGNFTPHFGGGRTRRFKKRGKKSRRH